MSFTRTIISQRSNLNYGSGLESNVVQSSKAVFGTADMGTALGIVKSAGFKELGSKFVLTNNSRPDTIVFSGLGKEMTYEVALKTGAAIPWKGQVLRLPAPVGTGLAEVLMVVDEFESKYEEEGYRMGTLTGTFHEGLMDPAAVANDAHELMSSRFVDGALVDTTAQPTVVTGINGN